jgi:tetratricopeptide (TPR) repeat protein
MKLPLLGLLLAAACCFQPLIANAQSGSAGENHSFRGVSGVVMDPAWIARVDAIATEANNSDRAGVTAAKAGQNEEAEADYRHALSVFPYDGLAYQRLAELYASEGKTAEAIATYRQLMYPPKSSVASDIRTRENYVILLAQTGQWQEAVYVYDENAGWFPTGDLPCAAVQFNVNDPQPQAMEAAAHVALGADASCQEDFINKIDLARMQSEFDKAVQLEPTWDVAQFYDAFGIRRSGRWREARAAFAKIAATGNGPVEISAAKQAQM